MNKTTKNRVFITAADVIEEYENNLITLKSADGTIYEKLEPRRLFPVSLKNSYITLLDEDGKEIAVIRELTDLNPDALKIITEKLDDYYLVPCITKLISTSEKNDALFWVVETTRGKKRIEIRDRNHSIRSYKDGRMRIRDVYDNRYIIEDYNKLDSHSQKLLKMDL